MAPPDRPDRLVARLDGGGPDGGEPAPVARFDGLERAATAPAAAVGDLAVGDLAVGDPAAGDPGGPHATAPVAAVGNLGGEPAGSPVAAVGNVGGAESAGSPAVDPAGGGGPEPLSGLPAVADLAEGVRRRRAPAARGADAPARPTRPRRGSPGVGGARSVEERSGSVDPGSGDRGTADPLVDGRGGGGAAAGRGRGRSRGVRGAPAQIDPDADPVVAAREICLRLLTERARTRQELAQALRRNGVPDDAAHSVLERFDEVGLIDDAAFAGQWVRSRHNHRGLAKRAIAMELRRKGVDDEVAGEALAELDPESEERRARELVERKLRTVPADTPEQRRKAATRLVGMLARKGYGGGVAYRVVKEALAAHGADPEDFGEGPVD